MAPLPVLFGYNINGIGNSSVPLSFCKHWNTTGLSSSLYAPSVDSHITYSWVRPAMGNLKKKLVYRFGSDSTPKELTEAFFFSQEKEAPHVYLWAALSLGIFEKFHKQGAKIIIERINCHQQMAKSILDRTYEREGIPTDHGITDESIGIENQKLALTDAIFCPSPRVVDSLIDIDIDKEKLLPTSYGWSPSRFPDRDQPKEHNSKCTFLFVGTLCVRKGVPLLLRAWEKSGLDAELIFCGSMDQTIKHHFGHYFDRPDINHIPFTNDIGSYYRKADIFVFPTLEEGGPMVTYEAMAHSVVPLVTSMGAGAIVENGISGIVLPDDDVDQWASSLTKLFENSQKREEMANTARERAQQFTWENVAAKRAQLLKNKFPSLWRS